MMQKGSHYKGFVVLDTEPLVEYGGRGLWLRHENTGLSVVHVHNDDCENLFAFAFNTPPCDNSGIAHITEHCASYDFDTLEHTRSSARASLSVSA